MEEIIFAISESAEGGYEAKALGLSIYTEGDNWDEIKENIKEAILCYFDDDQSRIIRMHFVKDEVLTV